MSIKPTHIKTTLYPTKGFKGRYKVKQAIKHLKPDDEISLNVVHHRIDEGKIQVFNDPDQAVPFFTSMHENEFSEYFLEML